MFRRESNQSQPSRHSESLPWYIFAKAAQEPLEKSESYFGLNGNTTGGRGTATEEPSNCLVSILQAPNFEQSRHSLLSL